MSFDPAVFDEGVFGSQAFSEEGCLFDQNIFDSAIFDTCEEVEAEVLADTHDGVGGSEIIYKRPHKRLHDEIEEYFARLTETEADEVVMEARAVVANEGARAAVADTLHARAVAEVAKLIENEQREELMALMALAMDEDDAEAVLVMMETLH
jgi:hypothetical protein